MASFPSEKILESNLKYFEIHAAQRLSVFNFYVAISGTMLAGMAAISQASPRFAVAGSILGLLLSVISFVFYKLDFRTSFLVKHAEDVIKKIESDYLPDEISVFALEASSTRDAQAGARFPSKMYTYGQLFRAIFWIFGLIGIAGFFVMGLRAASVLDWSETEANPRELTVVVQPIVAPPERKVDPKNSSLNAGRSTGLPNDVRKMTRETDPLGK